VKGTGALIGISTSSDTGGAGTEACGGIAGAVVPVWPRPKIPVMCAPVVSCWLDRKCRLSDIVPRGTP
jgi:hypothetical protein